MPTLDAVARCPYPGLRAFFTEERDWYFGREAHVDAMLTCLEANRFLAIVGSSGSGKSSLVFAGLIPALREGQLAGTRTDEEGEPAPWSVVCFHPGNHPLDELTAAIVQESRAADDPHLAGYVRAALDSGDLVQALAVARLLDPSRETLVYADQFEELFRFTEKSSRAAQEEALRLSQLLVAAAEQKQARLHILLSMRSEFIGECERFPGLPELVSRSQFLAPRLNRKQLEQSLSCPARAVGWDVAPDALTALLNDCGNAPDQLPLAQHVLRRMWTRAAAAGRAQLTLEDYTATGGVRTAMAQHGDELLAALPEPQGGEVARVLFMALCDEREAGPPVRRVSSQDEVEALAGEQRALVPRVIEAFAGDDPGFIREDKGTLDVRHEAVLRQWPIIAEWRREEAASVGWLEQLANAAQAWEANPAEPDYWLGPRLRRANEWMEKQQPSAAWAARHGVANWERCLAFLRGSRAEASRLEQEKQEAEKLEAAARAESEAQRTRERRQRRWLVIMGVIGVVVLAAGVFSFMSERRARESERRARASEVVAQRAAQSLSTGLQALVATVGPSISNADWAIDEVERHKPQLLAAIRGADTGQPAKRAAIDDLANAVNAAESVSKEMSQLADALDKARGATVDPATRTEAEDMERQARLIADRFRRAMVNDEARAVVTAAFDRGISRLESVLKLIPVAPRETDDTPLNFVWLGVQEMPVIDALREAALALHLEHPELIFDARLKPVEDALKKWESLLKKSESPVAIWESGQAIALSPEGGVRVNRVRFAPNAPAAAPVIVAAYEDKHLRFWAADGTQPTKPVDMRYAVKDLAFNPLGDAAALAIEDGQDHFVPVLRWNGSLSIEGLQESNDKSAAKVRTTAFRRHTAEVADVEFSHGGERVASAGADKTVRVFDPRSLAQIYATSPPLPGIVTSVAFHRGDNLVVSGCDDGGVRLHTIDQAGVRLLGKFGAPALRPEFSYDGKLVVAAGGDRTARVWSIDSPGEIAKIEHTSAVTRATFRPAISTSSYPFVTTAENGEVRLVTLSGLASRPSKPPDDHLLEPRHPGPAVSASWSNDGTWLATVGGGEVLVWQWINGAPVARLQLPGLHAGTSRAEFSPDARWLVTYGGDQVALLWDLSKLSPP